MYHYFDRFGIPLLMVDVAKENYFVYGGIAVRQFPIVGSIIVIALLCVVYFWSWLATRLGWLIAPFGIVLVLAAFLIRHEAGIFAAHQQYALQRKTEYRAYPRIQVWTKENTKAGDALEKISADLAIGCHRLLLHNHDRLFLLRPLKGAAAADLPLEILPWDQIEFVRTLPDYTSCQ